MKLLLNLIKIILICILLTGCIQNCETFQKERLDYNWDYINLLPNQTLKTKDNKEIIIDKETRIWSDRAYLLLNQLLMDKI